MRLWPSGVLRGMRIAGRLAWRASRARSLAVLVSIPVEVLSFVGFGLAIRSFFDTAVGARSDGTAVAAGLVAFTFGLQQVIRQLQGNYVQQVNEQAGLLVDAEVLRTTAGLPGLEHLERPGYLDRVSRVRGQGVWIIDSFWSTLLSAGQVVRLVSVAVLLAVVHPLLVLIGAAAFAPVLLQRVGERKVRRALLAAAEDSRLDDHLLRLRLDPVTAREVVVSGAAPVLEQHSAQARQAATRRESRAQAASALLSLTGWAVFLLAYVGGLAVVASLVLNQSHTLGDLMMVLTLAIGLKSQIEGMLFTLTLVQRGSHVLDSYLWLLDYARTTRPGSGGPPHTLRRGIALEGVSFTYPGTDAAVLSDVDLTLPAGSLVAVVGAHGSGKTTLVKLLSGFYPPTRGAVTVDGTDLRTLDTHAWQQRITAAYQNFARFELSARDSVRIGDLRREPDDEAVWQALRDAEADGVVASLPEGLEARLGRRFGGADLSVGQWQRIALARACVRQEPLLVVLDEPTASLDAVSEYAVFSRQVAMARRTAAVTGAVTILVTHRFSTVTMADLILVLADGRIVERGNHADLLRTDGVYAKLFRLQQASYAG